MSTHLAHGSELNAPPRHRELKAQNFATKNKNHTFVPASKSMTYGVTVAHQILVLLVEVRILVGQHKKPRLTGAFLFDLRG